MKNLTLIRLGIILMLGIGFSQNNKAEAIPSPMGVSFQVFYNELSPYGDWVMDQRHGYVWIPNVGQDFHPYGSNGYWEMTNFGNTWVSYYDWGWAPFHYGRWYWDNFYGWAWVPGYEWGPAWVNWRTGGGYYGWAPLGPGIGINVSIGFHSNHWRFVPQRRFRHRHFHRYYVPSYNMVSIYNRTTIINNTYVYNNRTYVTGPSRRELERVTRGSVPVYQVNDRARPGRASVSNRTLNVYRPEIDNSRSANAQARPSRAFTSEEYRGRAATQNRGSVNDNGRSVSSRGSDAAVSNQRNSTAQQARTATPSRNQAITSTQRGQTRATAGQQSNRVNTSQPNTRGQVGTAPRTNSNTRNGSVNTGTTRQSQARTSPQQRQSAPAVKQQRSTNNTSPRVSSPSNSRTNSPSNVRQSAPSTRNTGTVRSTTSRPATKAAPARSSSRSSGTTSSSRGGRGNN
ncbi:DUF6600 domain-containing protein [Belliella aquatica]|nr:DUF6600 domain-containing protein [Belliella aquatica]MCH7405575.1 hypothetical protein [Belliella aquatica]